MNKFTQEQIVYILESWETDMHICPTDTTKIMVQSHITLNNVIYSLLKEIDGRYILGTKGQYFDREEIRNFIKKNWVSLKLGAKDE